MDAKFWHAKWESNQLGFHEPETNPLLVRHYPALSLDISCRVFVPLCGKTLDIRWLLSQGHRVVGAELSRIAVESLFDDLGCTPAIRKSGRLECYSTENLDIFVGDLFELTGTVLGPVDAIYDRAALVALPEQIRTSYAAHLMEISETAPQLLICYEYDQKMLNGPPFSVSNDEVTRHYHSAYSMTLLQSEPLAGGLKGCPATENVWLLKGR